MQDGLFYFRHSLMRRERKRRMSTQISIRLNPANPEHHLWNNHGTWFIHYTLHRPGYTKQRVRTSLRTGDLQLARQRRDECFTLLGARA
jgi:hypothetical protein